MHMKIKNKAHLQFISFFGLVCLLLPVAIQALWIYAFNLAATHQERVEIFSSYFPDFFHRSYTLAFVSLAFCILAIILSNVSLHLSGKWWKMINFSTLISSVLLVFLNLYQMM